MLRAGFGQQQEAVFELQCSQILPADLGGCFPVQPARDHQMEHEPNAILESDCDLFAQPPHLGNALPLGRRNRRRDRSQQERAANLSANELPAEDTLAQRFDINNHIGKFGHVS